MVKSTEKEKGSAEPAQRELEKKEKEVIKIAKKYSVRNQFRYSKSKEAGYHPHYIFGETNNRYISLGMTTHPSKKMKVSKIKSPNPNYKGDQYIQHKVFKMKKSAYKSKREKGWKFDSDDLPLIRRLKKKYKRGKK